LHAPANNKPIPFECADKKFFDEYLKLLHHPLEDEGVDFWWLDWQQGPHSEVKGVDPLWVLNHYHFLDSGRAGRVIGGSRSRGTLGLEVIGTLLGSLV
ncbi:hypothetical protein QT600_22510, partial [Xanthomonas citri pv. citri]